MTTPLPANRPATAPRTRPGRAPKDDPEHSPPRAPEHSPARDRERRLAQAAFAGAPTAVFGLLPADPADLTPRARWLAGVCLGAAGRYGAAATMLAPTGEPASASPDDAVPSLAASTRASHLRQLGRHAEAEPLDLLALRSAGSSPAAAVARADALVGLVADAVGALDLGLALDRLGAAEGDLAPGAGPRSAGGWIDGARWRGLVRLDWVRAETALLGGDPAAAVLAATAALDRARRAAAPRHVTKSLMMLGATTQAIGDENLAIRQLGSAAAAAARLGALPLVWPARLLLARLLDEGDPRTAERERQAAGSALCAIAGGLPAAEAASLLARPEIRFVVDSRDESLWDVP